MPEPILVYVDLNAEPHFVGHLWAHAASTESASFQYAAEWCASPLAFALEPALKIGQGAYHTNNGKALFGAIGDSAPDRWGRTLMLRLASLVENINHKPMVAEGHYGANMTGRTDSRIGGGGAATGAGVQFQTRVGALIGSWLLSQLPLPAAWGLGAATPIEMRFETEAQVDDILVATSEDGFVVIQAKNRVSLSPNLTSHFGQAVSQFVRHWLSCRNGDGTPPWNRPLDQTRDRLVLAVGANASSTRVGTLADSLRLISQPCGGALNAAQRDAFSKFASCVEQAWGEATADLYEPEVAKTLAGLIRIFHFDSANLEQAVLPAVTSLISNDPLDIRQLATSLENICGELMAQRGSIDLPSLRQGLFAQGLRLASPPNFRRDIELLRAHSADTARMK